MSLRNGKNIASIGAQRRLNQATDDLSSSYERLGSGLRINSASDDAAGLSVSSSLQADSRVYAQGIKNINDGISLLNVAQGALSQLSDIATRQEELAEQAANGVYSLTQRKALDKEANALKDEWNRIVDSTSFNGTKLFDGSLSGGLSIQSGYGTDGGVEFAIGQKLSRTVGTGSFSPFSSYSATGGADKGLILLDQYRLVKD